MARNLCFNANHVKQFIVEHDLAVEAIKFKKRLWRSKNRVRSGSQIIALFIKADIVGGGIDEFVGGIPESCNGTVRGLQVSPASSHKIYFQEYPFNIFM